MTKAQYLDLIRLLSSLESWSFAANHPLPDYLHDDLAEAVRLLSAEVLKND